MLINHSGKQRIVLELVGSHALSNIEFLRFIITDLPGGIT